MYSFKLDQKKKQKRRFLNGEVQIMSMRQLKLVSVTLRRMLLTEQVLSKQLIKQNLGM